MFEYMLIKDDRLLTGYVTSYTTEARVQGKYKKYYKTYPVTFSRPATGARREAETCQICGEKLEFKLRSKSTVSLLRVLLRVVGLIGVTLGIILFRH
jgi:hypothetical protein